MSTKLCMTRDINGYNAFGVIPSLDAARGSLSANTEQHFTVPNNNEYWLAICTYAPGANIWVDFYNTATVPGSSVSFGTTVINPAGRQVKGGSTISLITADATSPWFCIEFQVLNNYASLT